MVDLKIENIGQLIELAKKYLFDSDYDNVEDGLIADTVAELLPAPPPFPPLPWNTYKPFIKALVALIEKKDVVAFLLHTGEGIVPPPLRLLFPTDTIVTALKRGV